MGIKLTRRWELGVASGKKMQREKQSKHTGKMERERKETGKKNRGQK